MCWHHLETAVEKTIDFMPSIGRSVMKRDFLASAEGLSDLPNLLRFA